MQQSILAALNEERRYFSRRERRRWIEARRRREERGARDMLDRARLREAKRNQGAGD